jgi:hypothetical protein
MALSKSWVMCYGFSLIIIRKRLTSFFFCTLLKSKDGGKIYCIEVGEFVAAAFAAGRDVTLTRWGMKEENKKVYWS